GRAPHGRSAGTWIGPKVSLAVRVCVIEPGCALRRQKKTALSLAAGRSNVRRWLRGLDLNQRPSGYEPDEPPDCSTPRHRGVKDAKRAALAGQPCRLVNGFFPLAPAAMPGGVLLFQRLSVSTIGAAWFHGRVRDGIGWVTGAMTTKQ